MLELVIWKLVCALILIIVTFLFGLYPIYNEEKLKVNGSIICLCNAFAGGLLVSIGIFHILPEATAKFNGSVPSDQTGFPWVNLVTLTSFLCIYILEITVHEREEKLYENIQDRYERHHPHEHKHKQEHKHDHKHDHNLLLGDENHLRNCAPLKSR